MFERENVSEVDVFNCLEEGATSAPVFRDCAFNGTANVFVRLFCLCRHFHRICASLHFSSAQSLIFFFFF